MRLSDYLLGHTEVDSFKVDFRFQLVLRSSFVRPSFLIVLHLRAWDLNQRSPESKTTFSSAPSMSFQRPVCVCLVLQFITTTSPPWDSTSLCPVLCRARSVFLSGRCSCEGPGLSADFAFAPGNIPAFMTSGAFLSFCLPAQRRHVFNCSFSFGILVLPNRL